MFEEMPMRRNVVFQFVMINMYGKERDFVEMLSLFFGCLTAAILSGRHPTLSGCLTTAILSGRHPTLSECLTAAILSGRHPTFSGYLTATILSGRHPTFSGCLTAAILSGRHPTLIQMSHNRHSIRPTFHLLRISYIRRLPPDGRG